MLPEASVRSSLDSIVPAVDPAEVLRASLTKPAAVNAVSFQVEDSATTDVVSKQKTSTSADPIASKLASRFEMCNSSTADVPTAPPIMSPKSEGSLD